MQSLDEREAELAFKHQDEIEEAARWCKKEYPHRFDFLNQIWKLLTEEEESLRKFGLSTRNLKVQPALVLLTPAQALRLLESYKRAQLNNPTAWRTKRLADLQKLEADQKLDKIIAEIKATLKQQRDT